MSQKFPVMSLYRTVCRVRVTMGRNWTSRAYISSSVLMTDSIPFSPKNDWFYRWGEKRTLWINTSLMINFNNYIALEKEEYKNHCGFFIQTLIQMIFKFMYKAKCAILKYEHIFKSKEFFFIYLIGEHSYGILIPYRLPVAVNVCSVTNYPKS